jgi:hypothetical protein
MKLLGNLILTILICSISTNAISQTVGADPMDTLKPSQEICCLPTGTEEKLNVDLPNKVPPLIFLASDDAQFYPADFYEAKNKSSIKTTTSYFDLLHQYEYFHLISTAQFYLNNQDNSSFVF